MIYMFHYSVYSYSLLTNLALSFRRMSNSICLFFADSKNSTTYGKNEIYCFLDTNQSILIETLYTVIDHVFGTVDAYVLFTCFFVAIVYQKY